MNQTVLITGSSRGIGRSIACVLAESQTPYNIVINYKDSKEKALEVRDYIRSKKRDCIAIQGDVSNPEEVKKMFQAIRQKFRHVDILINNAGIGTHKLFQEISYQEWKEIFATNVDGMYHTIQQVLPSMISQKKGHIINIASIWGIVGAAMETHYSATKGAIIAFTKALAKECGYSGIRCNVIAPGAVRTDMLDVLNQDTLDFVVNETPLGRLGTPEDIAHLVEFLISEKGAFITGQVISPNGGFVIS